MKSKNTLLFILFIACTILVFAAPLFFEKDASYMFLDSINGVSPGTNGHLLGTDTLGRDVLNGLLSGARISLMISLLTVCSALLIAFVLNLLTSYIGNKRVQLNVFQILGFMVAAPFLYYYSFIAFAVPWIAKAVIFVGLLGIVMGILRSLRNVSKATYYFPLDTIGLRVYEVFSSVPRLMVLLIFIGLTPKNNVLSISLVIAFLLWPIFFRYIRLEILSEKGNDRFTSLKNLGYSNIRIVFRHFLPLMLPILSTPIVFALVSTILIEANLSFLGIGLSDEYVTWGKLLAEARRNTSAWWLIVFPGACLFFVFMFLNHWLRRSDKLQ